MIALITVVVPLLAFLLTVYLGWERVSDPLDLVLFGAMYLITLGGITVGFHRHFAHRSFQCPSWLSGLLLVSGSMAAQGPVLFWVGSHRVHHQCSDRAGDPHSPHLDSTGLVGWVMGFWNAHVGWMLRRRQARNLRATADLLREPAVRLLDRHYLKWVALGLIVPGVVGFGVRGWGWEGLLRGMLWGGLIRVFAVHHVTWSVNSICHLFGSRRFETHDESRNNPVFGLLALGEGWHNNHHADPASVRHGLAWWELDLSYWFIRMLKGIGLAWGLREPKISVTP